VIAGEGDVVRSEDGTVFVNDVPVRDDYVREEFRSHDDWGEVGQEGYYLVMGDHRNSSSDSRAWGQVPKKYIVGRVNARWWPLWDVRLFQLAQGRSHADEDACLVVAPVILEKYTLVVSLADGGNPPRERDDDARARLKHKCVVPVDEPRAGCGDETRMRTHATAE
jgi:hypothetical protein